ncbi:hypothetical protein [Burkholderia ubonensis]|uniref:hypothetical protein n=1 Tax=Burkholderia ubonensis TaxID=101571 RepID=UPI000A978C3F|nr:hypothetical protein [Burkholderia ubonensis]
MRRRARCATYAGHAELYADLRCAGNADGPDRRLPNDAAGGRGRIFIFSRELRWTLQIHSKKSINDRSSNTASPIEQFSLQPARAFAIADPRIFPHQTFPNFADISRN